MAFLGVVVDGGGGGGVRGYLSVQRACNTFNVRTPSTNSSESSQYASENLLRGRHTCGTKVKVCRSHWSPFPHNIKCSPWGGNWKKIAKYCDAHKPYSIRAQASDCLTARRLDPVEHRDSKGKAINSNDERVKSVYERMTRTQR